jgi:DNA-binding NarL/FixJ family response regulator
MLPTITVTLVDDDPHTLDLLEAWMTNSCYIPYHFQILNKATSGQEAIKKLQDQPCDLLILDLNLPDANGLSIAHFCKTLQKRPRILLYSGYDDWLEWKDTAHRDIQGYVLKGSPIEIIEKAVKKILEGGYYWDPAVYYQMHLKSLDQEPFVWVQPLTKRQEQVLSLLCQGDKQAQIAIKLNLSTNTVKTHLKKICKKAGCSDLESLKKKMT